MSEVHQGERHGQVRGRGAVRVLQAPRKKPTESRTPARSRLWRANVLVARMDTAAGKRSKDEL